MMVAPYASAESVGGCSHMHAYMCTRGLVYSHAHALCSRGVRVCEREGAQVQRTCVHAMQVCIMVCLPCSQSPPLAGECALVFTRHLRHANSLPASGPVPQWSGEYVHNRQQTHDVTDSAESFIGPSIARISYGYRTDVRGMYGGCTGDVRGMYG